jgi:hypothetical protein
VRCMSDEYADPSGNTEQFKAFAQKPADQADRGSRLPLIIGGVVALALVVLVVFLLLG